MRKRAMALLLSCGMLIPTMAGSFTVAAEEESSVSAELTGKRELSGELSLALFEGGNGADYWEELIARFEEEYPDVTVTYELNPKIGDIVKPKIIAGDVPDVIYDNINASDGLTLGLAKDHKLMELTDLFEENALDKDVPLKDVIMNGMLDGSRLCPYGDGKTYLAPLCTTPCGLIYNKTLFDEKGWEVPETWDEFFALGDVAKEEGRALITYAGIYPSYCESILYPAVASALGTEAIEDMNNYKEGSFSSPEVIEILKNIQRIADDGYLLDGTTGMNHTESQTQMMLGNALFIPNGTWIENEMADAPREGDDAFQFALLPCLKLEKEDATYVASGPEQMCIPTDAKNPEAAKEFIKFIYTDENVKLFGEKANGLISVKGGVELIKDYVSPSIYQMEKVLDDPDIITLTSSFATLPANSKFNVAEAIYANGLALVMNQQMTAEEWSQEVEDGFAQAREEMKAE